MFSNLISHKIIYYYCSSYKFYVFFGTFYSFFQKPHYSSISKNLFWNHFLHFYLALCSYQCIVLNLMTLWIFFNTNPWTIVCFDFIVCLTFSFFCHAGWLQILQYFQFLFFQVKMVNHCECHVIFQGIKHRLPENILRHFFIAIIYKIVATKRCIFNSFV